MNLFACVCARFLHAHTLTQITCESNACWFELPRSFCVCGQRESEKNNAFSLVTYAEIPCCYLCVCVCAFVPPASEYY